jgi:tartrate dehydrogenase/decarboxylase/D-malate dehydrogenase
MPFWDGRVEAIGEEFPDVTHDKYHIDILTAQFVMNPQRFDVVVASNLFGDILSDLGPPAPARSALRHRATSTPRANIPACSNPSTVRRPILRAKALPIRWARSGRRR